MARTTDPDEVARKRRAIAEHAGRLFARDGFAQTSVAAIARELEISSATVFYYFPDKAALFRAPFEEDLAAAEELARRAEAASDPVEEIVRIVLELAADTDKPEAAGMVVEVVRQAGHDPQLVDIVSRTSRTVQEALAGLVEHGIAQGTVDPDLDPAETAAWLQSIVDGAYLNAQAGRVPERQLRRTTLRYLTKEES